MTITLDELRQLYQRSRTEEEKEQCFNPYILDRLLIKNFNEIVQLYIDFGDERLASNDKILHSLEGKVVVECTNEQFGHEFYYQFLYLINRIEGNLFIAFIDVESFGKNSTITFFETLSKKMERGEKVYFFSYCKEIDYEDSFLQKMRDIHFNLPWRTIDYASDIYVTSRTYYLNLQDPKNSVADTKELIGMMNEDRFAEEKQHLGNVLAILEATKLPSGERDAFSCNNCLALKNWHFYDDRIELVFLMCEPNWSKCVDCVVKQNDAN